MDYSKKPLIQVLGTSSNSGKTTITMALCRHFSDLGYKVAPFKSVNMSLNSIALHDGREISRSVWLQSIAARTPPDYHMNPFLLKPEGNGKSQVIFNGKSIGVHTVTEYHEFMASEAMGIIREDLEFLFDNYDIVVAEGAGSPAEINLFGRDFANTVVSEIWGTPAILVGNIDTGGVFASLYGTVKLMKNSDLLRWLIINKMRGDAGLLGNGIESIEKLTGKKVIGVVPYIGKLDLPGEDSLNYDPLEHLVSTKIAVIKYPHMENYSEIDPLAIANIGFTYVDSSNKEMLENAEAILLPGSKRVDRDLEYLQDEGITYYLKRAHIRGTRILGICGGYQMLGKNIDFAGNQDYGNVSVKALGFLDINTIYEKEKKTGSVRGRFISATSGIEGEFEGYEIHYGKIITGDVNPLLSVENETEGSISENRSVIGTNIHGLLENQSFLKFFTGTHPTEFDYRKKIDENITKASQKIVKSLALHEIYGYLNLKNSESVNSTDGNADKIDYSTG